MSETTPPHAAEASPGEFGPVDVPVDGPVDGPVDDTDGQRWWRGDKSVVAMAVVVALGFALVVRGVLVGVTGDERAGLPAAIESLNPVPGAVQVLRQSSVFVDLAPGYTGTIAIDGTTIETVNIEDYRPRDIQPGQQIDLPAVTIYEPGNATLTFHPGSDAPIRQFDEGEHRVVLSFWLVTDGPERARTYTWTFNVL